MILSPVSVRFIKWLNFVKKLEVLIQAEAKNKVILLKDKEVDWVWLGSDLLRYNKVEFELSLSRNRILPF